MKIILASQSPRRRKMLREMGIPFSLWKGSVDEHTDGKAKPHVLVQTLARRKASAAYRDVGDDGALIIAADTIVVLGNTVLGKPENDDHARRMLRELSGTKHFVYSGVAAVFNGKTVSGYEKTAIKFRDISDREIDRYILTGEHRDKAGSYGIQEKGGYFVEKVDGDINNVVGLPILKLRNVILDNFGVDIFDLDRL